MKTERVQLAIVGGGPAGLAAALAAKEAGLTRIVLIERHEELGGILRQCIHNGFGLAYFGTEMTGPEYAQTLMGRMAEAGVRIELGAHATQLTADRRLYTIDPRHGVTCWDAEAVVLAMGCRERTRGAANLPGTRPAGIFTAGTVQNLVNIEGFLPGREAVIAGSGDIGLIMARRLTYEGVQVRGVVEIQPFPGGLTRNIAQCLDDFGIPLYLGHGISEIHGRDRVEGVTIAEAVTGASFHLPCDTLILSVGLIPETELAVAAGVELDPLTGGPVVETDLQTSRPGIFACGNVLHVNDLADSASVEGEIAGRGAAGFVLRGKEAAARIPVVPGGQLRSVVPQYLDPASGARLSLRAARPLRDAVLMANGRRFKKFPAVLPAESLSLTIEPGMLVPGGDGGIELRLEGAEHDSWRPDGDSLVCIVCPVGCRLKAERCGGEVKVTGAGCRKGVSYAGDELIEPVRTLTSTVAVDGSRSYLPIRSARPIPKRLVRRALDELGAVRAKPPVRMGEIVLANLAGTGIPAVASRSMLSS